MGAFRATTQYTTTTNSLRRTSLVIHCNIRLTPIYYWVASRSRIRSPQLDLNLGKLVLTAPGTSDVSHPILPTPLGPPMAYLSTIRRQLAPTVGQVTFGTSFQAEYAHAGIGETIAMGRVVYASDVPLVLLDET